MQSRPKLPIRRKRPENGSTDISFPDQPVEDDSVHNIVYANWSDGEEDHSAGGQSEGVPDPIERQSERSSLPFQPSGFLPSIRAFTVQCAQCFKWRLIPSKEKYEEIRGRIQVQPFFCETAREWRPDISCQDPPDTSQDGSSLWAVDEPNIAQPPPGWERILKIRSEGSTRFADVYYFSPTGKRMRSMVEVKKYLQDHPEYVEAGVTLSQFSFKIPRPVPENYVRNRPAPPPDLASP